LAALLGTPLDDVSAPQSDAADSQSPNLHQTNLHSTGHTPSVQSVPLANGPHEPESQGLKSLEIDVHAIDPNPFQPRRQFSDQELDSLAESIKEHQQLQPILVRRSGDRYELISGERRLRATVRAGLKTIRAELRDADDRLVAELAIIENLQRKDLNAIEKAMSFKRYLTEHRCTQEDLAKRLKIDRSTIANMMRLLELPDVITDSIQREEISAGHAKALLSLGSQREQLAFVQRIRQEGWSVRETEARVAQASSISPNRAEDAAVSRSTLPASRNSNDSAGSSPMRPPCPPKTAKPLKATHRPNPHSPTVGVVPAEA